MKIEYNNNLSIPIENIKAGECFLFKDKLNMKIDINGYISVDADYPNLVIDLHTNKLISIANGVIVSKVDAKIVVE